jgi:hypothetical protein
MSEVDKSRSTNLSWVFGLLLSAVIVGAAIVACRPSSDVGYVEIKAVPVVPVAATALYLDSTKLAPIRKGSTVLQQRIGTLKLQADGFAGTLTDLCNIVVRKDRITSVTISVLDRPPRCQCRFNSPDTSPERACVS